MKQEKYKFSKEEIRDLMKSFKVNTEQEALEKWAYIQYPIGNGVYNISRVGKSFIIIEEYN